MPHALTLTINGVQRSLTELEGAPTVAALVQHLGFRADRVALELNGDIVARTEWAATAVATGDRIELVHFVGGGRG